MIATSRKVSVMEMMMMLMVGSDTTHMIGIMTLCCS